MYRELWQHVSINTRLASKAELAVPLSGRSHIESYLHIELLFIWKKRLKPSGTRNIIYEAICPSTNTSVQQLLELLRYSKQTSNTGLIWKNIRTLVICISLFQTLNLVIFVSCSYIKGSRRDEQSIGWDMSTWKYSLQISVVDFWIPWSRFR